MPAAGAGLLAVAKNVTAGTDCANRDARRTPALRRRRRRRAGGARSRKWDRRESAVRDFALQRHSISERQQELLQARGGRHVAIVAGKQAVVAGFEAGIAIALPAHAAAAACRTTCADRRCPARPALTTGAECCPLLHRAPRNVRSPAMPRDRSAGAHRERNRRASERVSQIMLSSQRGP